MNDLVLLSVLELRRNYRELKFSADSQTAFEWVKEALETADIPHTLLEREGEAYVLAVGDDCTLRVGSSEEMLMFSTHAADANAEKKAETLETLAEKLFFRHPAAWMDGVGYLTRMPVKAGSGLQLRRVMHLHTLAHLKQTDATAREALRRWDCTLIREDGDCPDGSDLYALTNRRSFKKDAWKAVFEATAALAEKERLLSGRILAYPTSLMIDRAHRAYGLLRYARKMEWAEFCVLWSSVRFGAEHGILPLSVETADELLRIAKHPPAREGGQDAGVGYRRAEAVRQRIKEAENADIREL